MLFALTHPILMVDVVGLTQDREVALCLSSRVTNTLRDVRLMDTQSNLVCTSIGILGERDHGESLIDQSDRSLRFANFCCNDLDAAHSLGSSFRKTLASCVD